MKTASCRPLWCPPVPAAKQASVHWWRRGRAGIAPPVSILSPRARSTAVSRCHVAFTCVRRHAIPARAPPARCQSTSHADVDTPIAGSLATCQPRAVPTCAIKSVIGNGVVGNTGVRRGVVGGGRRTTCVCCSAGRSCGVHPTCVRSCVTRVTARPVSTPISRSCRVPVGPLPSCHLSPAAPPPPPATETAPSPAPAPTPPCTAVTSGTAPPAHTLWRNSAWGGTSP